MLFRSEPRPYLATPFSELRPKFSPDGKWVAYQSNESGQNQIYLNSYPSPTAKRQVSINGGVQPRWRRDGRELFFISPAGELMAAELSATLDVVHIQKLFDGMPTSGGIVWDVGPDGQKFIVVEQRVNSTNSITLLQNWPATLKK